VPHPLKPQTLYFTLAEQYRNRAAWLMHNNTIGKLNVLRMTDGAKYFLELLQSRTLLGRPVRDINDLPTNLGAGTNESQINFGDLNQYLTGDREEIGVETTTVGAGAFENHQVAFET
jgi:HK97 family phage major capsid protein